MTFRSDEDVRAVKVFVSKVKAMREAQKNYFRSRDGMMKAHAMTLEREVDQQLYQWDLERIRDEEREMEPELFPGN
ncbi:MAG: hypothetical protein LBK02_07590 [Treponema sp.]|nr:hypothetical protein [Treponema sp.]